MATFVFSTVGTILGGPVGGAIGALIGQSIDGEILAPSQRGPKVGDLGVQTSSYGTQIPKIYGSMRVAGSVVWATDLVQSEQTSGAKGQPDVTFSYKVSFAVALSARKAGAIGRIWADGKLLRGADGLFKVPVTFRYYEGGEDQDVDPLITSAEGMATTPAYRGLVLAVFEDLELAEYGNRIPFLTFEVIADDAPPTLGSILDNISDGAIIADAEQTLIGYAAYGRSMRAAAEPLVAMYDLALFDDGETIRSSGAGSPLVILESDLGQSSDDKPAKRLRREQPSSRSLPARMRLRFYDPDRDYQSGEARASAGDQSGVEEEQEIAAVMSAGEAKSLAQCVLADAWLGRERVHVSLPPAMTGIEPGSIVELPITPQNWRVEKVTIEGFVASAELKPVSPSAPPLALAATRGRALLAADVPAGEDLLLLVQSPSLEPASTDQQVVYLAASSNGPGWKSRTVLIEGAGRSFAVATARRKSVIGTALTRLGEGSSNLIDRINSVDLQLFDPDQWLTSCDTDALTNGVNLAMVGDELIQFGSAEPLGEGRFRLAELLRGRLGTEWAMASHGIGESFILLDPSTLVPLPLPPWAIGGTFTATIADTEVSTSATLGTGSIRPPSPIRLQATSDSSGGLLLKWTRRSRLGWAWIDEVDVPLGETSEAYAVDLSGRSGSVALRTAAPEIVLSADELAALGPKPWTVEVRQTGSFALSKPAVIQII